MNRNEYIGKITSLLSFLTDNQVKYIEKAQIVATLDSRTA